MRRRADVVLVDRGLFPSRERARAAILAGEVKVGGREISKAGEQIAEDAEIEVRESARFVSRGGIKLSRALEVFGVPVSGLRAVDVGASTGGFTDCLLQHGAAEVTAIDVGYGQLAWSLRNDERVVVLERTNIRDVTPEQVRAPFDLVTIDVSFIGLTKVLPSVLPLLAEEGHLLALVKPQFEAGKSRVGKRGVVKAEGTHLDVLERVIDALRESGLAVRGMTWSPITGPEGNIEFWVWASFRGEETDVRPADVVAGAHRDLGV